MVEVEIVLDKSSKPYPPEWTMRVGDYDDYVHVEFENLQAGSVSLKVDLHFSVVEAQQIAGALLQAAGEATLWREADFQRQQEKAT